MNPSQLKTIREQVAMVGADIQPKLLPEPGLARRNAYAHIWLGIKTVFGEHWREGCVSEEVVLFVAWIAEHPNADYADFGGRVSPCALPTQNAKEEGLFG